MTWRLQKHAIRASEKKELSGTVKYTNMCAMPWAAQTFHHLHCVDIWLTQIGMDGTRHACEIKCRYLRMYGMWLELQTCSMIVKFLRPGFRNWTFSGFFMSRCLGVPDLFTIQSSGGSVSVSGAPTECGGRVRQVRDMNDAFVRCVELSGRKGKRAARGGRQGTMRRRRQCGRNAPRISYN